MGTHHNIRDALVGEGGRVGPVRAGAHHPFRVHLGGDGNISGSICSQFDTVKRWLTIQLKVTAGPLAGLHTMVKLPGKSLVTTATCKISLYHGGHSWHGWHGELMLDTSHHGLLQDLKAECWLWDWQLTPRVIQEVEQDGCGVETNLRSFIEVVGVVKFLPKTECPEWTFNYHQQCK